MQKIILFLFAAALSAGCQPPTTAVNTATSNSNSNIANSSANSSNLSNINSSSNTASPGADAREPDKYQALVTLNLEAVGDQQKTALPAINAIVSRSGADRRMEFALPNGEKVIYLDTAGTSYVILPNRKQYAELSKGAVGFEVRRLMMPEQIVNQVKNMQGVVPVGDETLNGRTVTKYRYAATANTQTRAGQVDTESYLMIDKETGLPLRSETVSQSQTGGNVQGYKGLRFVTEMSDIKTEPDANSFTVPTEFAKIDPEQVKSQVSLIFQAVAALVGQVIQQQAGPSATPSPAG